MPYDKSGKKIKKPTAAQTKAYKAGKAFQKPAGKVKTKKGKY